MWLKLQRSILLFLFMGVVVNAAEEIRRTPVILLLGDSLTAGYGVDRDDAYPALLMDKIRQIGWQAEIIDASISGTTTAGGVRLLDWHLRRQIEVLVIALGGNDGLRGVSPAESKTNLQHIIAKARHKYPAIDIILAGMKALPNMGETYGAEFYQLYQDLAAENQITLLPFLLEGVGGIPEMNQADGIHPNPAGQRVIADLVWSVIKPILEKYQGDHDVPKPESDKLHH